MIKTLFSSTIFVCMAIWQAGAQDAFTEISDPNLAINAPDEYAWKLFVELNHPADITVCEPDPSKALGDDGKVYWEVWRHSPKVFLPRGEEPPNWSDACTADIDVAKLLGPSGQAGLGVAFAQELSGEASFVPELPEAEETRLNKASYEHILEHQLFNLDGQEARRQELLLAGKFAFEFPVEAKEIKAHWKELPASVDQSKYHIGVGDDGKTYGLVALHIITRDLPMWFWATWEHMDNAEFWPEQDPSNFAGWVVPSVDTFACPSNQADCNRIPNGLGLEGTKWENYRLRGTQVSYVDTKGRPTVLTNSKIEGRFEQTSMSCITCHALSAKGPREAFDGTPQPLQIFAGLNDENKPVGFVGVPDPARFNIVEGFNFPDRLAYTQLDFIFSLRCAHRIGADDGLCFGR